MKSLSLKNLRNKADALLSPTIIKLFPVCLLCGGNTQVAHHHFHKSKSNRLRYEIENLINLCASCHFKLHQNESKWASEIVRIKGLSWYEKLRVMEQGYVKVDRYFYEEAIDRFTKWLKL